MGVFVVEGTGVEAGGGAVRRITAFMSAADTAGFTVYEAAGPDAVRGALTSNSLSVPIWAAVNLSPSAPGGGRELYVVEERFEPPIDLSKAAPENPELAPCLQRNDVAWVTSFIAADGTQCRCVYDAVDGEAVRASYRAAKIPFAKVWRARREA